ncbi:MAG: cytochrome c oxidase subunit 3 [Acidobacteria bacterium]|nr:cytochrome c oxidase subunit 3 [Acidobacteriota bacterium]
MTAVLELPAPPLPERRNVMLVGTMLVIVAGVTLFGGLLAAYFSARNATVHAGGTWAPEAGTLPNAALAITYSALFLSSFTAQWAVSAIKANERRQAYVAVGVTLMLGAAFINGLSFCWGQLHLVAGADNYASYVYAISAVHLFVVVAAMLLFVVMGFRVFGGQFHARNAEFVASATAFWHFAVVAGIAVWWCLWFLAGGPTS